MARTRVVGAPAVIRKDRHPSSRLGRSGTALKPRDAGWIAQGAAPTSAAALSAPTTAARLGPPDKPGPFAVKEINVTLNRNGRAIRVAAELPVGRGQAPVVVFLPGFMIDSKHYDQTTRYLASHGFVVLRTDPAGGVLEWDHDQMSLDAVHALDWATKSAGPLAGLINANAIGIAGHSLGGKLATMTALRDPRIKAVFAIDPVNQRKPDIFKPGALDTLRVPLGIIGQTTDTKGRPLRPAATPEGANFQAFYEKAVSAPEIWAVELAKADHFDFVDEKTAVEGLASRQGKASREGVLALTRTLLAAFFREQLTGEDLEPRAFAPPGCWQGR